VGILATDRKLNEEVGIMEPQRSARETRPNLDKNVGGEKEKSGSAQGVTLQPSRGFHFTEKQEKKEEVQVNL